MAAQLVPDDARHMRAAEAVLAAIAPIGLSADQVVALWAHFAGNCAAVLEILNGVPRAEVDAMIEANVAEGRRKGELILHTGRA